MHDPAGHTRGLVQPSLGHGEAGEASFSIAEHELAPSALWYLVQHAPSLYRQRHDVWPGVLGSRGGQGDRIGLDFSPPQVGNFAAALGGQN